MFIPTIVIFVIIVVTFVLTSMMPAIADAAPKRPIINPNKKVDGRSTHKKRVGFVDDVDVMKYDTVSGGSLGMTRSRLAAEVVGSAEKDVLGGLLKIAGDVEEIAPLI